MKSATRPALRRFAAIDRSIRAGDYPNARGIARELEVSHRTIKRDIEFLRDSLGAPLGFCRRHNGYFYTCDTWQLPYFQLTEGEMLALFVTERALREYHGTPYEADLRRAFEKIAVSLPEEITVDLSALDQTHSFRHSTVTLQDLETFQRLVSAVLRRRRIRVTYWTASRDEETEREIDPYHLANIDGEWFLIGYCHLREEIRMFAPTRIRRLEETGDGFTRPADFNIAAYLDGSFRVVRESNAHSHHVRLRFNRAAAKWVREKVWHPSQQMKDTPHGLELSLHVSSLIEVRRWVLSFGADCEVLAPRELRDSIQQEAQTLTNLYNTQTKAPAKPLAASIKTRSRRHQQTG